MITTRTLQARPALAVGQQACLTRTIYALDSVIFADLTGDDNPLHLDPEYVSDTSFGQPTAHALLVAGLFAAVLGSKLPGHGGVCLSQNLRFTGPVYFGETITEAATVIAIHADEATVTLRTACVKQNGEAAVEGEATVLVPGLGAEEPRFATILNCGTLLPSSNLALAVDPGNKDASSRLAQPENAAKR